MFSGSRHLLCVCILCRSVKERRRILEQNMKEVPNRIIFSEMEEIHVSARSSIIRDVSDINPLSVHIMSKTWLSSIIRDISDINPLSVHIMSKTWLSSIIIDISDINPLSVHIISKTWLSSLPKQLHQVCQVFEFYTYIFSVFHLVINRR
jgi:hypothetical protein